MSLVALAMQKVHRTLLLHTNPTCAGVTARAQPEPMVRNRVSFRQFPDMHVGTGKSPLIGVDRKCRGEAEAVLG